MAWSTLSDIQRLLNFYHFSVHHIDNYCLFTVQVEVKTKTIHKGCCTDVSKGWYTDHKNGIDHNRGSQTGDEHRDCSLSMFIHKGCQKRWIFSVENRWFQHVFNFVMWHNLHCWKAAFLPVILLFISSRSDIPVLSYGSKREMNNKISMHFNRTGSWQCHREGLPANPAAALSCSRPATYFLSDIPCLWSVQKIMHFTHHWAMYGS